MRTAITFFLLSLLITLNCTAQVDPVDSNGIAIGGYDVVSYFLDGMATKGDTNISSRYNNATWYFSSEKHKTVFDSNPTKYLPQYDGFCALAVATTRRKISINPELFKVTNGKLYLFYHGRLYSGDVYNSIEPWLKDEKAMIKNADTNWPEVKNKKYNIKSK